jgi:hypothetical protein
MKSTPRRVLLAASVLATFAFPPSRAAAAGTISYLPGPTRYVTAWQRTSTNLFASDSLSQVPSSPFAAFNGLVALDQSDGFLIVGSASQASSLDPTQIRAQGRSALVMDSRVGMQDDAGTASLFHVFFHLNEAHDATLYIYAQETDAAGGATGTCAVWLDDDNWDGTDPGTVYLVPHYALAAGNHELYAGVDTYGIISPVNGEPAHHDGSAEYFLVVNLDGGTADAPGATSVASLRVLTNPVHGAALFSYALPRPGAVRLRIFDLAGREVASPLVGEGAAGPGMARWDTAGMPAGLYLARLESPGIAPIVQRVVVTH